MQHESTVVRFAGESISETVVTAVADAKGVDPVSLGPLYEVIEPDALDRLFQADGISVEFRMAGYRVTVTGDRHVVVTPGNADASTAES